MRLLLLAAATLALLAVGFVAAPIASAQTLTAADRVPLRAEGGELVHPTLGFRVLDIGLPRDAAARPSVDGAEYVWHMERGEDSVDVLLVASVTPRALSQEIVDRTVTRLGLGGAVLVESAHARGRSTATLRRGRQTALVHAFPFRHEGRLFVLAVTAVHTDGELAQAVATSLEVPPPPPAVPTASGLARESIRETVRDHDADVRRCYERGLTQRPDLQGRILASFLVGELGTVQSVRITESTLSDATVEACVVDVVQSMRFPRPEGGGEIGVNYPFVFAPEP